MNYLHSVLHYASLGYNTFNIDVFIIKKTDNKPEKTKIKLTKIRFSKHNFGEYGVGPTCYITDVNSLKKYLVVVLKDRGCRIVCPENY